MILHGKKRNSFLKIKKNINWFYSFVLRKKKRPGPPFVLLSSPFRPLNLRNIAKMRKAISDIWKIWHVVICQLEAAFVSKKDETIANMKRLDANRVKSIIYRNWGFFRYCDFTCKKAPFGVCLKFITPFVAEIVIFWNFKKSTEIQIKPTVSAPK